MGYKDKAKQNEFQRLWVARRRQEFIAKQGPCPCGSSEKLTLVRKTERGSAPSTKVWSYSQKNREKALAKFDVRCGPCAKRVIHDRLREMHMGTPGNVAELEMRDVWAIRGRLLGKESMRSIARDYGLTHHGVRAIQLGWTWSWLTPGRRSVAGVKAIPVARKARK